MITTLTGSNRFLLQQELKRLIADFVAEHTDIGLEKLDGEEVGYDRIREALESLPFLASKKLIVLRAPGTNKQFAEQAEKLLTELPENIDVVIVEPKLDKRLTYAKWLQKHTDYKEFKELDEPALVNWLVAFAKEQDATLSSTDARHLIERVGVEQQLLAQEVLKLKLFDQHITKEIINVLTDPTPSSTIFELLDAALAGNTARAMKLYDQQRAAKVEPQAIIAMLVWQLHILSIIKTAGNKDPATIAQEAKLNPFVVRKSLAIAKHMTLQDLKQLVHRVRLLDIDLKTKSINADDALKHLLISLQPT